MFGFRQPIKDGDVRHVGNHKQWRANVPFFARRTHGWNVPLGGHNRLVPIRRIGRGSLHPETRFRTNFIGLHSVATLHDERDSVRYGKATGSRQTGLELSECRERTGWVTSSPLFELAGKSVAFSGLPDRIQIEKGPPLPPIQTQKEHRIGGYQKQDPETDDGSEIDGCRSHLTGRRGFVRHTRRKPRSSHFARTEREKKKETGKGKKRERE